MAKWRADGLLIIGDHIVGKVVRMGDHYYYVAMLPDGAMTTGRHQTRRGAQSAVRKALREYAERERDNP